MDEKITLTVTVDADCLRRLEDRMASAEDGSDALNELANVIARALRDAQGVASGVQVRQGMAVGESAAWTD